MTPSQNSTSLEFYQPINILISSIWIFSTDKNESFSTFFFIDVPQCYLCTIKSFKPLYASDLFVSRKLTRLVRQRLTGESLYFILLCHWGYRLINYTEKSETSINSHVSWHISLIHRALNYASPTDWKIAGEQVKMKSKTVDSTSRPFILWNTFG